MMKFFRKYNKHLLAVFMALLLVIWLGGDALQDLAAPDPSKRIIGADVSGPISEADHHLADWETSILAQMGLDWQGWQLAFMQQRPKPEDRLELIDWILLKREAQRHNIHVSLEEAESRLNAMYRGQADTLVRQVAARANEPTEKIYAAVARYLSVQRMIELLDAATIMPESELRLRADDAMERASIDAVVFPAQSFTDPDKTFTEEEIQAQFAAHKSERAGEGLNFGYYVDPKVKVQFIRVDPDQLKKHLRVADKSLQVEAYNYWEANKQDPTFRRTPAEISALEEQAQADAGTNGTPAPVEPYYQSFEEAQEKALDAVRRRKAIAEAGRIAEQLNRDLREPWFTIEADTNGYREAPERVTEADYYQDVVAHLPNALQYPEGIEVKSLELMDRDQLGTVQGFGQAYVPMPEGERLMAPEAAFDVQGLAEPPAEERRDTSLHLSLYETLPKVFTDPQSASYLFRVIEVAPGHEPESFEEVSERVLADLRLLHGMEEARAAAHDFVENIGTAGLKAAYEANEDLEQQITPGQGGGYYAVPPFPRRKLRPEGTPNRVMTLGKVSDEFIDKAFELAAAEDAPPAVVDLPAEAKVAVIKGKSITPVYEEDFVRSRGQWAQMQQRINRARLLGQWLNAQQVRERNQYKIKREA